MRGTDRDKHFLIHPSQYFSKHSHSAGTRLLQIFKLFIELLGEKEQGKEEKKGRLKTYFQS